MNLGIDLGWTIKGNKLTGDNNSPAPDCFDIISRFHKIFDNIYIISKVTSEQKDRAEIWLATNDFFKKTGIKPENVYFCFERRDKSLFAKALDINYFIDDRPEVLMNLDENVVKFLINPTKEDCIKYDCLAFRNTTIVRTWKEIEFYIENYTKPWYKL